MPSLELKDFNIDWSVFDQPQRTLMEKALENGHYEDLSAILFEVTPLQAIEIEKIQRQLRPRSFQFESKVQQDFERFFEDHFHDMTPQMEAEWQAKIDKEKEDKLLQMNGGIVQDSSLKLQDGGNQLVATISNDLHNVRGLGEASIKRLNAANIYAIDELRKLSQDKRKEILGPLVAGKIRSLI